MSKPPVALFLSEAVLPYNLQKQNPHKYVNSPQFRVKKELNNKISLHPKKYGDSLEQLVIASNFVVDNIVLNFNDVPSIVKFVTKFCLKQPREKYYPPKTIDQCFDLLSIRFIIETLAQGKIFANTNKAIANVGLSAEDRFIKMVSETLNDKTSFSEIEAKIPFKMGVLNSALLELKKLGFCTATKPFTKKDTVKVLLKKYNDKYPFSSDQKLITDVKESFPEIKDRSLLSNIGFYNLQLRLIANDFFKMCDSLMKERLDSTIKSNPTIENVFLSCGIRHAANLYPEEFKYAQGHLYMDRDTYFSKNIQIDGRKISVHVLALDHKPEHPGLATETFRHALRKSGLMTDVNINKINQQRILHTSVKEIITQTSKDICEYSHYHDIKGLQKLSPTSSMSECKQVVEQDITARGDITQAICVDQSLQQYFWTNPLFDSRSGDLNVCGKITDTSTSITTQDEL